jgi:hypothetical protein
MQLDTLLSVFQLQSTDTYTGPDTDNYGAISLKTAALGILTSPVRKRIIFAVFFPVLWVRTLPLFTYRKHVYRTTYCESVQSTYHVVLV